jgi:indole-3-glycerol phosphate synthase
MSEFTTSNPIQDINDVAFLTWMKRRDERVSKIVAQMEAKQVEETEKALKDAKQAVEDAEVALYLAKEQEKEVIIEAKKAMPSGTFDYNNFAAWAKSSSTPSQNADGRLKTF